MRPMTASVTDFPVHDVRHRGATQALGRQKN
jgi:hypothetical protein